MGKLDQLLDAYEEAIIDLAVERVRGMDSMTLLRYERYLDAARDDIEQYVENWRREGSMANGTAPTTSARAVVVGDVVQIDPAHDPLFGGHFLVVTEVKSWGVQGYCLALKEGPMLAYYRVKWESMVRIGRAEWVQPGAVEEDGDEHA